MINLYKQVPTVYSEASRDFQYISWLINIVLNSVKHNVDDIYSLPNSSVTSKLAELLALTLGFKIRRHYDEAQLLALVNIIPSLLKHKGTPYALELAGNALIKASGAIGECIIVTDEAAIEQLKENGIIKIILPKDLVDTTLFIDLLPYILPAGISCQIVRDTAKSRGLETIIGYNSRMTAAWVKEATVGKRNISGLFDTSSDSDGNVVHDKPNFTNFFNDDEDMLNAGLLSNTIIPSISEPIRDDED